MQKSATTGLKILLILSLALGFGCEQTPSATGQNPRPLNLKDVGSSPAPIREAKASAGGHRVYVPCYSHIRVAEGRTYKLAINLSIRNTSLDEQMTVTLVDYYDSSGALIKHHADERVVLKPLETVDFFVTEKDPSGGFGANFIVEWENTKSLSPPVIEAVMIGTGGGQGVSFVSQGVPIP